MEALIAHGQPIHQYTPSGVFVREAILVPTNLEKREAVLRAMIRGFHFKLSHEILPANYSIAIAWINEAKVKDTWQDFTKKSVQMKSWGDVFGYQYLPLLGQSVAMWLFLFYETILFQCFVAPESEPVPIQQSQITLLDGIEEKNRNDQ